MNVFDVGTRIYSGDGSLENIKDLNIKRACIVCDPFMISSGMISNLTQVLNSCGNEYMIYSEIIPDPSIDIVIQGVYKIIEFNPRSIIAFGGGSAIDAAKAMSYFYSKIIKADKLLFIAIPTTSGTGSEVTSFSVISDTIKQVKYPLIDKSLLPDIAILEPKLVVSVPPKITADTGMDVLTHALEAYVSIKADDFSDAFAEKAIKLVFEYLPKACSNPKDIIAREKMHNASCMAGIAFNHAGLGINHSMAHALGATFHIPHGKSNAILLPYVIQFNGGLTSVVQKQSSADKKYAEAAKLLGLSAPTSNIGTGNLVRSINNLIKSIGVEANVKSVGVVEKEFMQRVEHMASVAVNDRCTPTNPVPVTKEILKELYHRSYFGK